MTAQTLRAPAPTPAVRRRRSAIEREHADAVLATVRTVAQELIETELTAHLAQVNGNLEPGQPRLQRNGFRQRSWTTPLGTIGLDMPKLRIGSFRPLVVASGAAGRRRVVSFVVDAYAGVCGRAGLDDLIDRLGIEAADPARISELWDMVHSDVVAFHQRQINGDVHRYLWVDVEARAGERRGRSDEPRQVAIYSILEDHRIDLLATGLVGGSDPEAWTRLLMGLRDRGLDGVSLVVAHTHPGLEQAVAQVFGCPVQRDAGMFTKTLMRYVHPRHMHAVMRSVDDALHAADAGYAHAVIDDLVAQLASATPKVAELVGRTRHTLLALHDLPEEDRIHVRAVAIGTNGSAPRPAGTVARRGAHAYGLGRISPSSASARPRTASAAA